MHRKHLNSLNSGGSTALSHPMGIWLDIVVRPTSYHVCSFFRDKVGKLFGKSIIPFSKYSPFKKAASTVFFSCLMTANNDQFLALQF